MIIKSYIFPPNKYFEALKQQKVVQIDTAENYQKRSYRNRYDILTANGPLTLSIPLKQGKNNQQNIREVKIAFDENWQKKHLEAIRSAYGKSAYFEHYFPMIEKLLSNKETFLFDLNFNCLIAMIKSFKIDLIIEESNIYHADENVNFKAISKPYPQVFESKFGFTKQLSSLDLLFNMGPESTLYF